VPADLVCLSHLRWDFVYQRPNHLMARAARDRRVYFVEEPRVEPGAEVRLESVPRDGVTVVTPVVPPGIQGLALVSTLAGLVDRLVATEGLDDPVLWYYTPMAFPWTRHVQTAAVVYDCMDFLAGFRGAPAELLELETELLARADVVYSGGSSLYGRLAERHSNVHAFPSSVDVAHFSRARDGLPLPVDLTSAPRPRIVYTGVLDERVDLALIEGLAIARPDVSIVLIGPVTKIDPSDIPSCPNICLLGMRSYHTLPSYLGACDVGWMPFARNEATRFISPTKTLEYLAAGLPVVSTSIQDVVTPFATEALAKIADTVADTSAAVDDVLAGTRPSRADVDEFLAGRSWDSTWAAMAALVDERVKTMRASRGPALSAPGREHPVARS
jgi:glycosyltransferase involved in cell wall biosynthesis